MTKTKKHRRFRTEGMTPKTLTNMYRIWCHCEPLGWGQSYSDVANALGLTIQYVVNIANIMGWENRFRFTGWDYLDHKGRDDPDALGVIDQFRLIAASE